MPQNDGPRWQGQIARRHSLHGHRLCPGQRGCCHGLMAQDRRPATPDSVDAVRLELP